jgi:hypothetical protein
MWQKFELVASPTETFTAGTICSDRGEPLVICSLLYKRCGENRRNKCNIVFGAFVVCLLNEINEQIL